MNEKVQILPASEGGCQVILIILPAEQDLEALPAIQLARLQRDLIIFPVFIFLMLRAVCTTLQPGMLSLLRLEVSEGKDFLRVQIADGNLLKTGVRLIALQPDLSFVFRRHAADHADSFR